MSSNEPPVSITIIGASVTEMSQISAWLPDYRIRTATRAPEPEDLTLSFSNDQAGNRHLHLSIYEQTGPLQPMKTLPRATYSLPVQSFNEDTLCLVLDLLVRKRKEIHKNSTYEYAYRHANDAILVADCDHSIRNINPATIDKFGYSEDEFLHMDIRMLFLHERDSKDLLKHICGDEEYKKDYILQKKNGDEFPATVAAFMMNEEEGQFLVVIRDISKRKELEHIKVKQDQLTATGKMARIIAHELRNPLYNIMLASQLLRDTASGDANEEQMIIQRNCQRIDDLIRQLLEPGQWNQLSLKPVSVSEIVNRALHQVQDRLQLKQVSVNTDIDPDIMIMTDAQKMETAFINLVVNAIEAIEEGNGEISITAAAAGTNAFIRVTDNGRGMSTQEQQELFSPYYTTKTHGLGLGLVNTRQIIEAHEGQLKFESQPGQGTTFVISLARHSPE